VCEWAEEEDKIMGFHCASTGVRRWIVYIESTRESGVVR